MTIQSVHFQKIDALGMPRKVEDDALADGFLVFQDGPCHAEQHGMGAGVSLCIPMQGKLTWGGIGKQGIGRGDNGSRRVGLDDAFEGQMP